MKIKHYNEMMAYLTRPGFNGGGSVSNRNVLPKRKPAEEVKKRKKINYEKLKQYLGKESQELIERELGFAVGGGVNPAQLKQRFMQLVSSIQDADDAEIPSIVAQAKQIRNQIDELNRQLAPDRQIKIAAEGLQFDNPLVDAARIKEAVKPVQGIKPAQAIKSITKDNPAKALVPDFPKGDKGTLADPEEKLDPKRRVAVDPRGAVVQASMKGRRTDKTYGDYLRKRELFESIDPTITETEGSFAEGGDVDTPKRGLVDEPGSYSQDDDLGRYIYEKTVDGKKVYELEIRQQKEGKRKVIYQKRLPANLDNLKELQTIRDTQFADLMASKLSNQKFLELREINKNLNNEEFAKYLNTKTKFKPVGGGKWNRKSIDKFAQRAGFKSDVYRVPEDVKKNIYKDYLKQVETGETNLTELARKYFPDTSVPLKTRQKRVFGVLQRDFGVDRSSFKTEFDPESKYRSKAKTRYVRKKRIQDALNKAGPRTKAQYLQLESKILDLNEKISSMTNEEILNNKSLMKALNVNASVENLNKGIITFDKYKNLSDEDQVFKIRRLADEGVFFQPEHIKEVATAQQNIVYPNNLQVAPGKIGSYMNNIKTYVKNNPDGDAIPAIKSFLKEFGLSVKEGGQNLGFENIIYNSKTGTSNIVERGANILNQADGPIIGMNRFNPALLDFRKLPDDVKDVSNVIRDLIKTPGGKRIARNLIKAGKFTGYGLAGEVAFAAPFALDDYASGLTGDRILGNATLGIFGTTEDEEVKKATGKLGYATNTIKELENLLPELAKKYESYNDENDPRGEKRLQFQNLFNSTVDRYNKAYNLFVTDRGEFDKELYNQGVNNYAAGLSQIEKFRAAKEKERGIKGEVTGFELVDSYNPNNVQLDLSFIGGNPLEFRRIDKAGGGIAKEGGVESGVAPESGPTPDGPKGLFSALKYVKKS